MIQKDKIIGPFETKSALFLIGINEDSLHLIKVNFISLLKHSISLQIPFLFTNHIENLKARSINNLISFHKALKIEIDENLIININRSKYWKHEIHIKYSTSSLKLMVLQRSMIDEYERIFRNIAN